MSLKFPIVRCLAAFFCLAVSGFSQGEALLNPRSIPKFIVPLPRLPIVQAAAPIDMGLFEVKRQLLPPGYPASLLWAFGTAADTATYPGPIIEVKKGTDVQLSWQRHLPEMHLFRRQGEASGQDLRLPTALHLRDMPHVVHYGGPSAETPDGVQTFTEHGEAGTYWYRDQSPDGGTINREAGLLGAYVVRDPGRETELELPRAANEITIVLDAKDFYADGSIKSSMAGHNLGQVVLANGTAWPFVDVEQHRYRLHFLNASSQRFFKLAFNTPSNTLRPKMLQIGCDGGFLKRPVNISYLLLGPGEIGDVVVDFVGYRTGLQFDLVNTAPMPYPNGPEPEATAAGSVMQFRMVPSGSAPLLKADMSSLQEKTLATVSLDLPKDLPVRKILIHEYALQPSMQTPETGAALFNSAHVAAANMPQSPEIWEIINPSIQTRQVQLGALRFLVLSRQQIRTHRYLSALDVANLGNVLDTYGHIIGAQAYLSGDIDAPGDTEKHWKSGVRANAGEVTRVAVRWAGAGTATPLHDNSSAISALASVATFSSGWRDTAGPCDCNGSRR